MSLFSLSTWSILWAGWVEGTFLLLALFSWSTPSWLKVIVGGWVAHVIIVTASDIKLRTWGFWLGTSDSGLSNLLEPSWTFLNLLEPSGTFWNPLKPSGTLWNPLEPSGTFWNLLEPFGTFWNLLEPSGTFWNLLEPSGTFWKLLEPSGTFWNLLEPSRTWEFQLGNRQTDIH